MSKSTKSAGKTAVAHARAWVESIHPGSLVLEASKKVKRFPSKDLNGKEIWVSRTVEEDIFGVFDLAVFPVGSLVSMIQVTTISRDISNVRARQTKVGNFIRNHYPRLKPSWLCEFYVVGWVARKHLRIWTWDWRQIDLHTFGGWVEGEPDPAKLATRIASAASSDEAAASPLMAF